MAIELRETVPAVIANEASRLWNQLLKTDQVPAWAALRCGRRTLMKRYKDLNPGDCEQLVEHHTRAARAAIRRWNQRRSHRTVRTAAEHIFRTWVYRTLYMTLLGRDYDPADMPFSSRENSGRSGDDISRRRRIVMSRRRRRLPPMEGHHRVIEGPRLRSYTVGDWYEKGKAAGVALAIDVEGIPGEIVLRMRTPAAVDTMIQCLLRHKRHVWPHAP